MHFSVFYLQRMTIVCMRRLKTDSLYNMYIIDNRTGLFQAPYSRVAAMNFVQLILMNKEMKEVIVVLFSKPFYIS